VKKSVTPLNDGSPIVPKDCPPEDRYYWLAIWMIHLVTSWKMLDYEAIFSVPVNLEEVPNYKEFIIHEPIDLSLMQRRAVDFRYPHLAALVADLHKLVDNAIAFNGRASPIALLAKSLRTKALASVRKLMVEEREVSRASRDMSEVVWPTECWLFQPPNKQASPEKTSGGSDSMTDTEVSAAATPLVEAPPVEEEVVVEEEAVFGDEDMDQVSAAPALSPQEKEDQLHYQWMQSEEGVAFAQRMKVAADKDKNVLGYVHWTFPDQTIEDQYPSYMMARRLNPADNNPSPDNNPSSSSSGPSVVVPATMVSPEVGGGFPRGVTPRGDAFVAKFATAAHCEYLGSFKTQREAKVAYNEAKSEHADKSAMTSDEKRAVKPPPPCDNLLQHIDKWLVDVPPTMVAQRMAHAQVSPCAAMTSSDSSSSVGGDTDKSPTSLVVGENSCEVIPVESQSQSESMIEPVSEADRDSSLKTSPIADMPPVQDEVQPLVSTKKVANKKKPVKEKLYNKLVRVLDQPPCYPHQ
jgi:hypothetical protein